MDMKIKCLEIRDRNTFIPVMCFKPIPDNAAQRYLMRRDGWCCDPSEHCVMVIDTHKRRARYDPYDYGRDYPRTMPEAHKYIENHWDSLVDGDVIDVEFILGETSSKKVSEAHDA
jgi:hypothetical protein